MVSVCVIQEEILSVRLRDDGQHDQTVHYILCFLFLVAQNDGTEAFLVDNPKDCASAGDSDWIHAAELVLLPSACVSTY